jgi:hypothetical protein
LSFSAPSCVNFNHFFTSIRNLHIICAHHHFLVLLFFKFFRHSGLHCKSCLDVPEVFELHHQVVN